MKTIEILKNSDSNEILKALEEKGIIKIIPSPPVFSKGDIISLSFTVTDIDKDSLHVYYYIKGERFEGWINKTWLEANGKRVI